MTKELTQPPTDTGWYTKARFGPFIHWGIYSPAACHEWVKQLARIFEEDHRRYSSGHFCPDARVQTTGRGTGRRAVFEGVAV
jgi:hypothetical protein